MIKERKRTDMRLSEDRDVNRKKKNIDPEKSERRIPKEMTSLDLLAQKVTFRNIAAQRGSL